VGDAPTTAAGSSDSPCFDLNWNLLAMHHCSDLGSNHPRSNQEVPLAAIRECLMQARKADVLDGELP
jgi:hypothetical protein